MKRKAITLYSIDQCQAQQECTLLGFGFHQLDASILILRHADGEAVIMLAFQASGRGSTPLRRILFFRLVER